MKKRDTLKKIVIDLVFFLFLSMIFAIVFRATQMGVNARVGPGQSTPYPAPITTLSVPSNPTTQSLLPGVQNPYPAPNISQTPNVSSTPPKPTATPLMTKDGWYLYVDKEVGYSFSYPRDAHIQLGKNPLHPYNAVTIFFPIPNSYGYHGMVIDVVENFEKLSPEDFAKSVYKSVSPNAIVPDNLLSKAETITVAGSSALKVQIPPTLTDFIIFLPYQDKMFKIHPSGDPFNTGDTAKGETLNLFYKVLGTLTFGT